MRNEVNLILVMHSFQVKNMKFKKQKSGKNRISRGDHLTKLFDWTQFQAVSCVLGVLVGNGNTANLNLH